MAAMRAVLSDIHGNLEALDAVLADAARHGATEVYCLGDLVGIGPNPVECIERALTWPVVLLGSLDQAAPTDPDPDRLRGQLVMRAVLRARLILERNRRDDLWAFLNGRPHSHREGDLLFVHGSPLNPIRGYVFPEDIYNQGKMERIFALIERYCFCGNTGVPGVFTADDACRCGLHDPNEIDGAWRLDGCKPIVGGVWHLDGRKTVVNVGSVGQPRDGDPRACYVLLDGPTVAFRRVEYDVATTVRKIRDDPDLDDFFADRLPEGR